MPIEAFVICLTIIGIGASAILAIMIEMRGDNGDW